MHSTTVDEEGMKSLGARPNSGFVEGPGRLWRDNRGPLDVVPKGVLEVKENWLWSELWGEAKECVLLDGSDHRLETLPSSSHPVWASARTGRKNLRNEYTEMNKEQHMKARRRRSHFGMKIYLIVIRIIGRLKNVKRENRYCQAREVIDPTPSIFPTLPYISFKEFTMCYKVILLGKLRIKVRRQIDFRGKRH